MSVASIRRKFLLRLLADLDQQIAEVESLTSEHVLTNGERGLAADVLVSRRTSVKRVEGMLAGFDDESGS